MAADKEALLKVNDIRREYPTPAEPLVVLRGVNFELGAGESVAIMGPSGSGKSTLLHILGTLDHPTPGTLSIDQTDPFGLTETERATFRNRKIGFVFQDHYLLPQCSVLENVLIPTLVGNGNGPQLEKRALDLLERVGLSGRLEHRPAELSGGERQRVAIARALIHSPILLLCDEPTGNLDSKASQSVGEIFRSLQAEEKTALVVVTHSPDFARLFDRELRMVDGTLEDGTPR